MEGFLVLYCCLFQVPKLIIPGKRISIENSDDILQYIYASQQAKNPKQVAFLEPSPDSLVWTEKINKLGQDLTYFNAYHVSYIISQNNNCSHENGYQLKETIFA